ncbi:MAG: hypothetical protein HY517_04085 [Candidatus Aenigmarchaeota archaeon]|nr:hypothetical protein [Candidatus Aenigmarchaeota archaeon]
MRILKIDKKWRVILPRSLRRQAGIQNATHLEARASGGVITMKVLKASRIRDDDPLIRSLRKPLRAKKKVSKADLERIENEMWLP